MVVIMVIYVSKTMKIIVLLQSARLVIGTSNDSDDHIYLAPSSNVGVKTTVPSYTLQVTGTLY